MSGFVSGTTSQLEAFARNKRAAGALCRSYEDNLRRFDAWCAAEFPGAERLTQGMVDGWCSKRPTESANSCRSRCAVVVALVVFLRLRGETAVVPPELPRRQGTGYAPHAFTDDELSAFFAACDAWEPHRNTCEALWQRTRLTPSVVFRLLWSSGIRTCEARLLTRDRADLAAGVLDIAAGKRRAPRGCAPPVHAAPYERVRRGHGGVLPGQVVFLPERYRRLRLEAAPELLVPEAVERGFVRAGDALHAAALCGGESYVAGVADPQAGGLGPPELAT